MKKTIALLLVLLLALGVLSAVAESELVILDDAAIENFAVEPGNSIELEDVSFQGEKVSIGVVSESDEVDAGDLLVDDLLVGGGNTRELPVAPDVGDSEGSAIAGEAAVDTDEGFPLSVTTNASDDFRIDKEGVLQGYIGESLSVVIPNGVVAIGKEAFRHSKITSIVIPSFVKYIYADAFDYCYSLKTVKLSSGLEWIGGRAFFSCTSLESIEIPGTVTRIYEEAFLHCEALKSVSLSEGLIILDQGVFKYCDALESINLPETLETIGENAFRGTDCFEDLVIPDSVKMIGSRAFSESNALRSVKLGSGVESIGDYCFASNANLTKLTMNDGLTGIGFRAFDNSPIEELLFPDGVEKIHCETIQASGALKESLKKVRWPAGIPEISGELFSRCPSLEEVILPEGVTAIGRGAFESCSALKIVNLPGTLKTIDDDSFYNCVSLTEIAIPESVINIADRAFGVCDNLTIFGKTGSYAQAFAESHGIPFIDNEKPQPSGVTLSKSKATLVAGQKLTLNATINPATAVTTLSWSSSNEKVATVTQKGVVKAIGKGKTNITVKTSNGRKATCKIIVPEAPTGITLSKTKATLVVGAKLTLETKLNPIKAMTVLTWTSSNEKVAAVTQKGVVKAIGKGKATITVTTANGKKAICKITVPAAPTKITLSKTKVTLVAGAKLTLTAKLNPTKAKTTLTWSSSDKKVATVTSKGVVKAVKAGAATITVKTANGVKATCRITVSAAPTKVAFAKKSYSVKAGKKITLKTKLTPAKASTTLTWSSSNRKIATVSNKGVVKGVRKGTVIITVKTANGRKATVKVTVK